MIYHITSRTSWSAAQKSGAYTADSLASEGFIHCSKVEQVLRVASTWYAGQRGLALLEIDETRLRSEVRWERVHDFEPDPVGHFTLPLSLNTEN
jgi:uncharacterized protein (DUF952 family)